MYTIVHKRALNPSVTWMDIEAPFIARKAKAGQFVILRVNETGERIPLTIASADPEKGTVTIIFQKVGKTTMRLDELEEWDSMTRLSLIVMMEDDYGKKVKRSEVMNYTTVQDIVDSME